ncbi:hypothetical protein Taro_024675 [Colocasia esculenta]|uniref:Uncharacterized protein n=1 Tax=Colocasia esculenta TaxID=4460 RepID=A0A843VI65_COLES|nr:hypothetical protein [Colocasia esculenta]
MGACGGEGRQTDRREGSWGGALGAPAGKRKGLLLDRLLYGEEAGKTNPPASPSPQNPPTPSSSSSSSPANSFLLVPLSNPRPFDFLQVPVRAHAASLYVDSVFEGAPASIFSSAPSCSCQSAQIPGSSGFPTRCTYKGAASLQRHHLQQASEKVALRSSCVHTPVLLGSNVVLGFASFSEAGFFSGVGRSDTAADGCLA